MPTGPLLQAQGPLLSKLPPGFAAPGLMSLQAQAAALQLHNDLQANALHTLELVRRMGLLFQHCAAKFAAHPLLGGTGAVAVVQAWLPQAAALPMEQLGLAAGEVSLYAEPNLMILGDARFEEFRILSCRAPLQYKNSMPGRVWRTGAVQVVQNLRIVPPTLHPRSQLREEDLDRVAEVLYIPVYDTLRPARGPVAVLEAFMSSLCRQPIIAADFLSFVGSALAALQLSVSNPLPQPVRRSALCGRRARAAADDSSPSMAPETQPSAAAAAAGGGAATAAAGPPATTASEHPTAGGNGAAPGTGAHAAGSTGQARSVEPPAARAFHSPAEGAVFQARISDGAAATQSQAHQHVHQQQIGTSPDHAHSSDAAPEAAQSRQNGVGLHAGCSGTGAGGAAGTADDGGAGEADDDELPCKVRKISRSKSMHVVSRAASPTGSSQDTGHDSSDADEGDEEGGQEAAPTAGGNAADQSDAQHGLGSHAAEARGKGGVQNGGVSGAHEQAAQMQQECPSSL